jgi:hypothetical protein
LALSAEHHRRLQEHAPLGEERCVIRQKAGKVVGFKLWKSINNLVKTGELLADTRVSGNDETFVLSQGF